MERASQKTSVFLAMVFAAAAAAILLPAPPVFANCPDRPACTGCGYKGGPGYRGPDGKCVGFKNLERICGDPPTTHCVFENAPGTGLNQACALGLEEVVITMREDE